MKWVGHVAHMGEVRNSLFWSENLKGRDLLEDIGIGGRLGG
jgi:hypothetical protein